MTVCDRSRSVTIFLDKGSFFCFTRNDYCIGKWYRVSNFLVRCPLERYHDRGPPFHLTRDQHQRPRRQSTDHARFRFQARAALRLGYVDESLRFGDGTIAARQTWHQGFVLLLGSVFEKGRVGRGEATRAYGAEENRHRERRGRGINVATPDVAIEDTDGEHRGGDETYRVKTVCEYLG